MTARRLALAPLLLAAAGVLGMPARATGAEIIAGRLSATGDVRLRWQTIDTDGLLTGLYGEPLVPGTSFLHRFYLEVSGQVTGRITAGGLLRVSNEPERVLALGPDYLSNQFGSAFLAAEWPAVALRAGYYRTHLTPFGLMRWDQEDLGLGGAQRGCSVCGGARAGILSESLEEIGPDLTFEGARAEGAIGALDLDWSVLYARPHAATLDLVPGLGIFDEETYRYHQDLVAARAVHSRLHAPSLGFRRLGATFYHVRDDPENPPCPTLPEAAICSALEQSAAGADFRFPIGRRFVAAGEWLATAARPDARGDSLPVEWDHGLSLSGELVLWPEHLVLRSAYLYLGADFLSPYSALTYRPNRSGQRHRLTATAGPVAVEAFFRRVRPVVAEFAVPERAWLEAEQVTSIQGTFDWRFGIQLLAGWQEERRSINARGEWEDDYRSAEQRILLLELQRETRPAVFYVTQQWLSEEAIEEASGESSGTMLLAGAKVRF